MRIQFASLRREGAAHPTDRNPSILGDVRGTRSSGLWPGGNQVSPGREDIAATGNPQRKMPLLRWTFALAAATGRAASSQAALPTVTSLSELDDRSLVAEAQAGNRAAFEELVHRYDREVLRLALNLMRRPEDARDAYQEAFLKVYRNLHRFRFECSFYTWLYRVVTNVCLDHLRRRRARPEDQAPELASAQGEDSVTSFFERQREDRATLDPERRLIGKEIERRLATAMLRLSPRERIVFEMRHYHGLKLRAIGEALGTTEETVKNSLFRATRKLRSQLGELR
jgi:RNA polymerase sigma-70 factor (ECF subfamily)